MIQVGERDRAANLFDRLANVARTRTAERGFPWPRLVQHVGAVSAAMDLAGRRHRLGLVLVSRRLQVVTNIHLESHSTHRSR